MRFINEYKFSSLIILFILIIGGSFYWFEWRPNNARKYCEREAQTFQRMSTTEEPRDFRENLYKICLRERYGLEK